MPPRADGSGPGDSGAYEPRGENYGEPGAGDHSEHGEESWRESDRFVLAVEVCGEKSAGDDGGPHESRDDESIRPAS